MTLKILLRASAIVGSIIWGFYLVIGWWGYFQMLDIGGASGIYSSVIAEARNALVIQTVIAAVLFLFGLFSKEKNSLK